MTPKEAKQLLELLAQGIDPETGEVLPADNPLNSPAVIRALFLGARALGADAARGPVSASVPAQAGKPWSREEDGRLIKEFDAGTSIDRLAQAHGRSKGGIASRLVRLGKISERSEVYVREPAPTGAPSVGTAGSGTSSEA